MQEENPIDIHDVTSKVASLLGTVSLSLSDMSLEEKIEAGTLLWELGDVMKDLLDSIKEDVRKKAVEQLNGQPGLAKLNGERDGQAHVRLPNPSLRARKGVNIQELKDVLGADFSLFFEETTKIVPRKEFEDRVLSVEKPLHQKVLHNAVEHVDPTPRVGSKRKG